MPENKKQKQKLRHKAVNEGAHWVLMISLIFGVAGSSINIAHADPYDEQINALRSQNNIRQTQINDLAAEAGSYQGAISLLQAQINTLRSSLDGNLAKQRALQQKITEAQDKINQDKQYLSATIKSMYVDDNLSTIEALATSKNLSDYVDREEYRTGVQNKIDKAIKQITSLQAQMKKQKSELDILVGSQQEQNNQLASARSQQQQLLGYNQSQQSAYTSQIGAANAQIVKLKQAQAAELARKFGSSGGVAGGGSYPWGNAVCIHTGSASGPCPNYDWAINGSIWNPATNGYGYRNCTDYVAWRLGAPAGLGNANQWPTNAQNKYGIGHNSSPRPGDAAVDESGFYGHVMYVESVSAGGIVVSDYNRIGDGLYRITSLTKVGEGLYKSPTGVTSALTFVHF